MKKLLTVGTLCILACILFSSCSSNLTIAKRHYTKGYYIEYANHTQTVQPKEEEKTTESNRMLSLHSLPCLAKVSTIEGHFDQEQKTYPIVSVPFRQGMSRKAISPLYAGQITTPYTTVSYASEGPVLQTKQAFTQADEYGGDGGERAALSLLWIVILVILILW